MSITMGGFHPKLKVPISVDDTGNEFFNIVLLRETALLIVILVVEFVLMLALF